MRYFVLLTFCAAAIVSSNTDAECAALINSINLVQSLGCPDVCPGASPSTPSTPTTSSSTPSTKPTTISTKTTTSTSSSPAAGGVQKTFPHRVIYVNGFLDKWSMDGVQDVVKECIDWGFNYIIFSFWIYQDESSAVPKPFYDGIAAQWMASDSTPARRQEILDYARSRDAYILLAVGGGTENHGAFAERGLISGTDYGNFAADAVIAGGFHGVDLDSEQWQTMQFKNGIAVPWLADCTRAMAAKLPGKHISHAPQAPYFSEDWTLQGPTYKDVHTEVGHLIDFYFIQFYNQGATNYQTYEHEFIAHPQWFSGSSVKEISKVIPVEKIVYGKFTGSSGSTSKISPEVMKERICRANKEYGFNGGAGVWQYNNGQRTECSQFGQIISEGC